MTALSDARFPNDIGVGSIIAARGGNFERCIGQRHFTPTHALRRRRIDQRLPAQRVISGC